MSAEPPKTAYGDLHDGLTATWQFIEMERLNEILKECGVDEVELRRSILENYFFNSGYFFDSQWFEQDSRHFHPTLAFIEIDASNQPICCYLPNPDFGTCLHEYAHGCAGQLYEDYGEVVTDLIIGNCNT